MEKPQVLVLSGYGLNCDHETAYAFEMAGADARRVHINDLVNGEVQLEDFNILVFGGGFSWGDDHGAGVVQALRMKTHLGERIVTFVEKGNLVLGICNGFQTLVNMGLLPGIDGENRGNYTARSVALTYNDCGNFRDQWVHLKVNAQSPCVFTRGMDAMELPVRHGEGKFYAASEMLQQLIDNQQVVVQYAGAGGDVANQAFPDNPNGSVYDIAGICDTTGRIFGLMPHPEAFHHWTNHPDWTRMKENARRQGRAMTSEMTPGVRMFQNAVDFVRG